MEFDLNQTAARNKGAVAPQRTEVCIVGGGVAGLTLAYRLRESGVRVLLLEAGGKRMRKGEQETFSGAELEGVEHEGTRGERYRVFGGASLRWGAQMLPVPPACYQCKDDWPLSAEILATYYAAAEDLLDLDDRPYDANTFFRVRSAVTAPELFDRLHGVHVRLSKWADFSHRNLARSFGAKLADDIHTAVYLHAQVTEIVLDESGRRVAAVLATNDKGESLRVEAEHFVLTAGTVETVRLLLASRGQAKQGVGNDHDQVGRNFHDHLTLPVATLRGRARQYLLEQMRPWIFGHTIHSPKIEATPELRQRLGINAAAAHLTLEEAPGTGLALLRETLRSQQDGRLLESVLSHAPQLAAAGVQAGKMYLQAKAFHRRYVADSTIVRLQVNAAQDTPSESRITLGETLDEHGVPMPHVTWKITAHEVQTVRRFTQHLRSELQPLGLFGTEWVPQIFDEASELPNLTDARHAMGGAAMGTDPRTSVVDLNLAVHGIDNLSVGGPAVFPSGVAQLPSLVMMALCLRLADRVAMLVQGSAASR